MTVLPDCVCCISYWMLIQCYDTKEEMINKSFTGVNWNCVIACPSLDLLRQTDSHRALESFHLKQKAYTEYNHVVSLPLHSDDLTQCLF